MTRTHTRSLNCAVMLLCTVLASGIYGCARSKPKELMPKHISKYLLHQTHQPLQVPEEMEHVELVNLYPVPKGVPEKPGAFFEVEMPDELINPATGNIRVQSLGSKSWILIDIAASQIWPRLRSFVGANRLPVDNIDVQKGEITTRWLTPEGDLPREKYRFWIESGLRPNTSEIHLLQASEDYLDAHDNRWPESPVNGERARIMLDSIAGYLIDLSQTAVAVSAATSQFKQEARMRMEPTDNGLLSLVMDLGFDRAWAAVSLALDKADIFILDLNRDSGVYYIAYKPDQALSKREQKRLLEEQERARAREARDRGDQPGIEAAAPRPVSARIAERAKNLPKAQLRVTRESSHVVVDVYTEDTLSELKVAELNQLIKRIAAYIS